MANAEKTLDVISNGLGNLYLIMVKRKLKNIEDVPSRYKEYIKARL